MLAYPTPLFDAKTIREAPGYRPIGKSGSVKYDPQPEANTPESIVSRKAYNSRGFTGTRASKFIQNNQFLPVKREPGVYPLSKPEIVGNVFDAAPQPRPKFDAPANADMQRILSIMNSPLNDVTGGSLTAGQVRLLAERQNMATAKPEVGGFDAGSKVVTDFANTQAQLKRETQIRNAMAQGFTREEAVKAYEKVREKEAEKSLLAQQSVSQRLTDLVDSKLGGNQNGKYPGNDESALYLATRKESPEERRKKILQAISNRNPADDFGRRKDEETRGSRLANRQSAMELMTPRVKPFVETLKATKEEGKPGRPKGAKNKPRLSSDILGIPF
jgi:hypothetical protein